MEIDNKVDKFSIIFIIIIIILIWSFGFYLGLNNGYKEGQIDAINGVIKYELVINKDKSMTWAEKNESSTNTR